MSRGRKLILIVGLVVASIAVSAVLWLLLKPKKPVATPSPTPTASAALRGVTDDKFGPRARAQTASNVDIGIHYYTVAGNPKATPKASAKPRANAPSVPEAQEAAPMSSASPRPTTRRTTSPSPTVAVTPLPILVPPQFGALPIAKPTGNREIVVIYAKGAEDRRQIFMRSVERDKDTQIVTSVYDDYGVSLSSTSQRVAFYSNEEGPSDATHFRSKLKIVDLPTGKVTTIVGGLPGAWPAAWSPDGKRLAIPTANSIFLTDTTTGASLQVPTGREPGGITWSPDGKQVLFHAKSGDRSNFDLFAADAAIAQARTLVAGGDDERYPSWSNDGKKISYVRNKRGDGGTGGSVVVREVISKNERTIKDSQPTVSYLFNLDFSQMLFVRSGGEPQLQLYKDGRTTTIGTLKNPKVISWDRDYQHVFVLADDADGQTLHSVTVAGGKTEKIKGGISEFDPASR